ncbi:hypothetical protein LOK49_LG15G00169 [Camellia lanceoleosa]|uniref:Uncharacterized protein n=1 Tax=Camellia lanceoleosa TaxID=1840588 RepID=A0ACC0F052_9ERIC|nr:hypothetical protein LOK49_LG15G00169 [Camellia lanceoleosa]
MLGYIWNLRNAFSLHNLVLEVLVGNVQAHEDARQYMTRPEPYYKDLCGICRELSSDGRDSVSDHNLDQQDNIPEVKFARPLNNFQYPVESVSSEEVKMKLVILSIEISIVNLFVESDKADMDVETFYDGILAAIVVGEGEVALVGAPIGLLAKSQDEIAKAKAATSSSHSAPSAPPPHCRRCRLHRPGRLW